MAVPYRLGSAIKALATVSTFAAVITMGAFRGPYRKPYLLGAAHLQPQAETYVRI